MEPDAKPVVEHQCRLIPKMKEVVRNEVLKLLDAGIIYPIADSRWVMSVFWIPGYPGPPASGLLQWPSFSPGAQR
jgi:hypothetical protein